MAKAKPYIAFFGPDFSTAYFNGSVNYFRGIIKYLQKMGYSITYYQPDLFNHPQTENVPDTAQTRVISYKHDRFSLEMALVSAANADVVIKVNQTGLHDDYLNKVLTEIKRTDQKIVFWDMDAPATLQNILNGNTELKELLPAYDHILTNGGGDFVRNTYSQLNERGCVHIHCAVDQELHYRTASRPEYESDLTFIGNYKDDMREKVLEYFIKVAERMPDKKFLLAGMGWSKLKLPHNIKHLMLVPTKNHNSLFSSSKLVLNVSRGEQEDYTFSPNSHVFEAAAAGACIITDNWDGIEGFYNPLSEIWIADNGRQVESLWDMLDDNRCRSTGLRARRKTLLKHTYAERALKLDNILEEKEVMVS